PGRLVAKGAPALLPVIENKGGKAATISCEE
ncbi:MAG: hypothetical protein JWO89_615, partial [Verrucomicrobiaceae bacterium]|nr:hypothetical protein [Verrucomicrobiaceae bacterium]